MSESHINYAHHVICSPNLSHRLTQLSAAAQQYPSLQDGSNVSVTGTITVHPRGNRSFVLVKTETPYIAIFDQDREVVHEIGVSMNGQNLEKYAGKKITVKGKVQLEPVSPYYYNGTLILADSIQFSDGVVLLPKPQSAASPRNIPWRLYWVLATFSPRSHSFSYKAWDETGAPASNSDGLLSCGLNGPGDAMNCFCADGFAPTGMGGMQGNRFILTERPTMEFVQFAIPEDLKASISRAVECSRKGR